MRSFFFGFFFGTFFLITLETLPECADAFAKVLAKPTQPAYAEDDEYDDQYKYQLWPTNLWQHVSSPF
jgi:hypothetical protein